MKVLIPMPIQVQTCPHWCYWECGSRAVLLEVTRHLRTRWLHLLQLLCSWHAGYLHRMHKKLVGLLAYSFSADAQQTKHPCQAVRRGQDALRTELRWQKDTQKYNTPARAFGEEPSSNHSCARGHQLDVQPCPLRVPGARAALKHS